jgi:hypothetical protein
MLLDRDVALAAAAAIERHRLAFVDGDLTLRALFRSVLLSDEYRLGSSAEGEARERMLSTDQLGSSIEDLTGFRFTSSGYDLLGSDAHGVRTLAGGVDGVFSLQPAAEPTATVLLVQERLAQAAAAYAVAQERLAPESADLFAEIDFGETPATDLAAMVGQVQRLHLRVLGRRVEADGEEVAANLALWEELYALDANAEHAWAGVLTVLLRDPDFIFY